MSDRTDGSISGLMYDYSRRLSAGENHATVEGHEIDTQTVLESYDRALHPWMHGRRPHDLAERYGESILTTPTKLAWIGVGLSVGVGAATLRTAPEMTVLATAAGTTWLGITWLVSRDDRDQDVGESVEQTVATDGGDTEDIGRTYKRPCPECSRTISIVDRFCPRCGARVREEQTTNQHTETLS